MKRNLLMLCGLICFISPCVWADSTGTATPAKCQPEAVSPIQRIATSVRGTMAPKGNDASKADTKNTSEQAGNSAEKTKCCGWLVFFSIVPAILFIVFLMVVKSYLKDNKWSLGDALSESDPAKDLAGSVSKDKDGNPVFEVLKDKDGNPVFQVLKDKDGNPVFAKSSSRLIAFIGLFGIIVWIVGLSIPTLYQFACTGKVPELSGVSTFLLAQAGVFAPYIANKLVGAVKS